MENKEVIKIAEEDFHRLFATRKNCGKRKPSNHTIASSGGKAMDILRAKRSNIQTSEIKMTYKCTYL